jgi:hypothetical protein
VQFAIVDQANFDDRGRLHVRHKDIAEFNQHLRPTRFRA